MARRDRRHRSRRTVLRTLAGSIASGYTVGTASGVTGRRRGIQSAISVPGGQARIVEADPDTGFHHPYALYEPDTSYGTPRPLFVEPLNDTSVRTSDELHTQLEDAVRGGSFSIAHELGLPGLVAGFPRTPDDGGDWVQGLFLPSFGAEDTLDRIATDAFPAASLRRVDQQFTAMLGDARERLSTEEYPLTETIHMTGFSSSAQFSARFAVLYPGRVAAMSVGGNGAYPLPRASIDGTRLPYPLGTDDYSEITEREFDEGGWSDISQFVFLGEDDQPLPSTDERSYYPVSYRYESTAAEVYGRNRVTERLPVTRSVYEDAGADATFRVYEDVGHMQNSDMTDDAMSFHSDKAAVTPDDGLVSGTGDGFGLATAVAGSVASGYLLSRRRQAGHND